MTAADQPPLILVIMPSSESTSIRKSKRSIDEDILDIAFTDDESASDLFETFMAPLTVGTLPFRPMQTQCVIPRTGRVIMPALRVPVTDRVCL